MKITILISLLAMGCSAGSGQPNPPASGSVHLETAASGLQSPVHLSAPTGDSRLFVVEQAGTIRIVKAGQLLATPFLDIRSKVGSGGERGLLSVAFHPQYASNGFFYVNYTDKNGDTRVERYKVGSNADAADATSAKQIAFVAQPFSNHNGGLVQFGPDGALYIGMGDGGSGGDPQGNGQSPTALLGKMLRVNVDQEPFNVEIFALGLRNPWRWAFDPPSNLLYIADVGQNQYEEININPAASRGLNYGWNRMEAKHCYQSNCSQTGLVIPVIEYEHSDGCSITGGYVYRGSKIPSLQGHYFYADYCDGWVRSFKWENNAVTNAKKWDFGSIGQIPSFGVDGLGELYILSTNGNVYRIVS
ncbi:MAG TPA: PQQ-dependent sugar dehydrogenase [Longimicrobiales bacterium]|nr:PQQ-dependent sugar dehydrogenase [Longimicrobiales bacterium]